MLKGFTRLILLCGLLVGCSDEPWNSPYAANGSDSNTLFTAFSERPKHFDPARSYESSEWAVIGQVYEPPLQYEYLKRPFTVTPALTTALPTITMLDANGAETSSETDIAKVAYRLNLKSNINYAPHPAFVEDQNSKGKNNIADFKDTSFRTLRAEDFVYQIKRLADPRVQSPVYSLLAEHIVGLKQLRRELSAYLEQHPDTKNSFIDLRNFEFSGAKVIDELTYEIYLQRPYPQFKYWLCMPFFAAMPWEADRFYRLPGMDAKNITLDWYPVGTGAFYLTENNPNLRMVLKRNPNFHGETFPDVTDAKDQNVGFEALVGKELPFLDKIIFSLDKESIPYWNKFLQGYYDQSGIASDSFHQAVQVEASGELSLSPELAKKNIRLNSEVVPSTFYWAVNMRDPVIGGNSERARKLRQALAMTIDVEEYISIFLNGRGLVAQSLLPPSIFGYQEPEVGFNPQVYQSQNKQLVRKSLAQAKQVLAAAGYKNGIDPATGEPLILHFDVISRSSGDSAAFFDWMRKQFAKLDITLDIRATQYNRFQDKIRKGNAQIFSWGWNADYPDPENFFFLLYGPNGSVENNGTNSSNFDNPEFNRLYEQMRTMENSPERQQLIEQMIKISQHELPVLFAYHPKDFVLRHEWMGPRKNNPMARNTLKYVKVDGALRKAQQHTWNQPILWPLAVLALVLLLLIIPAAIILWRREYR